jgi:hypothetical protein
MDDPRVLACGDEAYLGSGSDSNGAAFSNPAGGADIIEQEPVEIAAPDPSGSQGASG